MGMKQWMTFGIKTEGADKAAKDIGDVGKAAKGAAKEQEGLNENIETGTSALDGMTGGAIGAFKGVVSGVKKAVLGMRTLKGAIISTGIGALVPIVASIVLYLTRTKKGAEQLEKASAVLGATMDVLAEALIPVGELLVTMFTDPQKAIASLEEVLGPVGAFLNTLFTDPMQGIQDFGVMIKDYVLGAFAKILEGSNLLTGSLFKLFSGDFKGAWEDASAGALVYADGLTDLMPLTAQMKMSYNLLNLAVDTYGDVIMTAAEKTLALTGASQSLADAQRRLSVEFAESRLEIAELNQIADDTSLSIEKRIAAAEKAGEIEKNLAAKRVALAQQAISIQRGQNSMVSETAENLQALADLQVELADAQTESSGVVTGLLTKVNGLYTEQQAKIDEGILKEKERLASVEESQATIDAITKDAQDTETNAVTEKYRKLRELAILNKTELVGDKKAEEIELAAITAKFAQQELDRAKSLHQKKTQIASNALGALMALNTAFSGDTAKQQEKAFKRNKKLGISSAIINSASAIIGAISPAAGGLGIPAGIPGALMAAASGAAQIATIAKTSFDSTGGDLDDPLTDGGDNDNLGSQASSAPQIDMGFLGQGSGSTMQAYVISEQVNNQLQADQIVTDQTTL